MRILCILQNAWGDRKLPITFVPHPAARNLTNQRCEEIREEIKRIGERNHD